MQFIIQNAHIFMILIRITINVLMEARLHLWQVKNY